MSSSPICPFPSISRAGVGKFFLKDQIGNILGLLCGYRTLWISVTTTLNSGIVAQKQPQTAPKAQATKGKVDKLIIIKITNFCDPKGTEKKVKKTTSRMEENI